MERPSFEAQETTTNETIEERIENLARRKIVAMNKKLRGVAGLDKRMGQHLSEILRGLAHSVDVSFEDNMNAVDRESEKIRAKKKTRKEGGAINDKEIEEHKIEKERILQETHNSLGGKIEQKEDDIYNWIGKLVDEMLEQYRELDKRNRKTMLYTRAELLRRVSRRIEEAEKNKKTIVCFNVDADMFKAWNDTFGHRVGDYILQIISLEMLEFAKRHQGDPARVGGEELTEAFSLDRGVALREKDVENLRERIQEKISLFIDDMQKEAGGAFDIREKLMQTLFSVRKFEANDIIKKSGDYGQWEQEVLELGVGIQSEKIGGMDPSEVYAKLEKKRKLFEKKGEHKKAKKIHNLQKKLAHMLPLGTVTIGVVQIDCSERGEHVMSEDDRLMVSDTLNNEIKRKTLEEEEVKEVFSECGFEKDPSIGNGPVIGEISYSKFVDIIEDRINALRENIQSNSENIPKVSKEDNNLALIKIKQSINKNKGKIAAWTRCLNRLRQIRAGRIIQFADVVQESWKKNKRNSVRFEGPLPISQVDYGNVAQSEEGESEEDKKFVIIHRAVKKETRKMDESLRAKLEQRKWKAVDFLKKEDPRIKKWKRFLQNISYHFLKHESYQNGSTKEIIKEVISAVDEHALSSFQKNIPDKYFDSLLRVFNDTYKEGILPHMVRRAFKEKEKKEKEGGKESQKYHFSVVSFDFDNLKAINAVAGRSFGDTVLRLAGVTIQDSIQDIPGAQFIRPSGGEEFILVLPGVSEQKSVEILKKVNENVSEKVKELLKDVKVDETSVYEMVQDYIKEKNGRSGKELEKIGTLTAAVVDIADLKEEMDSEDLLRHADSLGETMKGFYDEKRGETLRGHVLGRSEILKLKKGKKV